MSEEWPALFEQHLKEADLESRLALYAANARFVQRSDEVLIGCDPNRPALAELMVAQTRLNSRVVQAVTVGDVGLLDTDFDGKRLDAAGSTTAVQFKAVEVLRREGDGTRKFIVGDPNGCG